MEDSKRYDAWKREHENAGSFAANDGGKIAKKLSDAIRSAGYVIIRTPYAVPNNYGLAYAVKKLSKEKPPLVLYGDDDRIDEKTGNRVRPHFKPDWSPDTFESFPYTGEMLIVSEELLRTVSPEYYKKVSGGDLVVQALEIYDLTKTLFFKVQRNEIYHIRTIMSSITSHDHMPEKMMKTVRPEHSEFKGRTDVLPKVSIIVPSKDNPKLVKQCIDSIMDNTVYKGEYDIVLVDNGSNAENKAKIEEYIKKKPVKYVYQPMEFNFSAMCNLGVKNSDGDLIVLLNDDILVTQASWLSIMAGCALRHRTGAVGVKLYYPESNKIQHAGVIVTDEGPSHALSLFEDTKDYYYGRNKVPYNFLVVTAACLMVTREKYALVGGMPEDLRVAYNDVDFCMSLYERGFYNVLRNDITLYHYESVSRGADAMDGKKRERLDYERGILLSRHEKLLKKGDPFYNQNLSGDRLDYSLRVKEEYLATRDFVWQKDTTGEYRDFPMSIDKISVTDEAVLVKGWAYCQDDFLQEKGDMYLILRFSGGPVYYIPALSEIRQDAKVAVKSESSRLGFVAALPKETLLSNNPQIGFALRLKEKDVSGDSYTVSDVYNMTPSIVTLPEDLPCRVVPEPDGPQSYPAQEFVLKVEEKSFTGKHVTVKGYCFDKNEKYNTRLLYYIRLRTEDEEGETKYICTVQRKDRYDVCVKNPLKRNILNCGFYLSIDLPKEYDPEKIKADLLVEDTVTHKVRSVVL
ncbi:MAG: glycosyltransferase [Lachnospiraceae bacterium]|nr:glycosyltransferase [Lachnospiraceae bacterium]